jgi:hypothetical protein
MDENYKWYHYVAFTVLFVNASFSGGYLMLGVADTKPFLLKALFYILGTLPMISFYIIVKKEGDNSNRIKDLEKHIEYFGINKKTG